MSPLQELAYDSLQALKDRPYFNPGFIDKAIVYHREVHPDYRGEVSLDTDDFAP